MKDIPPGQWCYKPHRSVKLSNSPDTAAEGETLLIEFTFPYEKGSKSIYEKMCSATSCYKE